MRKLIGCLLFKQYANPRMSTTSVSSISFCFDTNKLDVRFGMEPRTEITSQIDLYPVVLAAQEGAASAITSAEAEEDSFRNSSKEITVEKSNDVVIGPMTHFHGPVTIHQSVSTQKIKNQSDSSNPAEDQVESKPTQIEKPKKPWTLTKRISISISVLLLVAGIAIAIALPLTQPTDETPTPTPETTTAAFLRFYTKSEWGGKPGRNNASLLHPTEYVVIYHTASRFCWRFEDCALIIQAIQLAHMQGSSDIHDSFLIGGDGFTYEGRGWDVVHFDGAKRVGVSFVGNFTKDKLEARMKTALISLLDEGLKLEKLAKNYVLICENQTTTTPSPGKNVYKMVSRLPHFKVGKVEIK